MINPLANAVTATIPVGSDPFGVAVEQFTGKVYVANFSSNTVSVINPATNAVIATIPVGGEPVGVAVNQLTGKVYVTNTHSDTVSVIGGHGHHPRRQRAGRSVRGGCRGVAISDREHCRARAFPQGAGTRLSGRAAASP